MKLSLNKWNVSVVGENKQINYYGWETKKEAQKFVDNWNQYHDLKVEVIKVK